MAIERLIDPSRYDISKLQYRRADIERLIPHRGVMALIDGIVDVDVDRQRIVGFKDVGANEFWRAGHFPGNPILPGVLLVEAAAQLVVYAYKLFVPEVKEKLVVFGGMEHVRFRGIVRPGDRIFLVGQHQGSTRRLARAYTQGIVNGDVVYEGLVIGIPTER